MKRVDAKCGVLDFEERREHRLVVGSDGYDVLKACVVGRALLG